MDYGKDTESIDYSQEQSKKYVYDETAFQYSLTDNKIEDEKNDMEFAEVEFQL